MADVDAWMPLWIGDYLRDTGDLSTEEHGAYFLLLMAAWKTAGALPNDQSKLARMARVSIGRWPPIWEALERFFRVEGDQLVQNRTRREREQAEDKKQKAVSRGRKGAETRHRASREQAGNKDQTEAGKTLAPAGDGDLGSGSVPIRDPISPASQQSDPDQTHARVDGSTEIRLPEGEVTGLALAGLFGRVRSEANPRAMPWAAPTNVAQKSEPIVTCANDDPAARADLLPTMRLLFAKALRGDVSESATVLKNPSFAFGAWCSQFTALREELHGLSEPAAKRPRESIYPRLKPC